MNSQRRARPGTAGLLVVMATTGALLAFGQREGDPTRAFRNAGRMLLQSRPVTPDYLPIVATAVGMVHHILIACSGGMLASSPVASGAGPSPPPRSAFP